MSRTKKLLQNPTEKAKASDKDEESFEETEESNQPVRGKITFYQVKKLYKLYTKGKAAFDSIVK